MSRGLPPTPAVRVAPRLGLRPALGESVASFVARVLDAVWTTEGRALALSVYVCGDRDMRELHARWLGDPAPTDVMSFPLAGDAAHGGFDGELVVCADVARVAAQKHGNSLCAELALYVAHGALHLLGYDDRTARERRRMQRAERRVLASLALTVHDRDE